MELHFEKFIVTTVKPATVPAIRVEMVTTVGKYPQQYGKILRKLEHLCPIKKITHHHIQPRLSFIIQKENNPILLTNHYKKAYTTVQLVPVLLYALCFAIWIFAERNKKL
ncbi:hypothetical protein TELCIR_08063 [Teladorsagia circumcincta]|uniref:Uncharacterized protein n=1 Tax=Teladorsagia circumcincta TaxID=45464 RepID=A0A2G9UK30_TELCI|nr:hypothetical protein TELCIR_08063 [Teladorsagia circumcincta]